MRLLRVNDYKRMPWKNGDGETTEILVSPPDASIETFDWRISMAHVGKAGPFSNFPGVDRTLAVAEGAGLTLALPDREPVALSPASEPFSFSGEVRVDCHLIDGPVDDLNIMSRRSRFRHRMSHCSVNTPTQMRRNADTAVVIVFGGGIDIRLGLHDLALAERDCMQLGSEDPGHFTASSSRPAELFLIEIWRTDTTSRP